MFLQIRNNFTKYFNKIYLTKDQMFYLFWKGKQYRMKQNYIPKIIDLIEIFPYVDISSSTFLY